MKMLHQVTIELDEEQSDIVGDAFPGDTEYVRDFNKTPGLFLAQILPDWRGFTVWGQYIPASVGKRLVWIIDIWMLKECRHMWE